MRMDQREKRKRRKDPVVLERGMQGTHKKDWYSRHTDGRVNRERSR